MTLRRTRFARPAPARAKRAANVLVRPLGGLHAGVPPSDLPPGFSPTLQNFVPTKAGEITPRSGLSKFGTHDFGGPVLGAAEVYDRQGRSCGFAPSDRTFSFFHPDVESWATLAYKPGTLSWMSGAPSGLSTQYFNTVSIYDADIEDFIAVTSNNTDSLKFFTVSSSVTNFSDFTFIDSISSARAAKDVAAVNDRLVLFNVKTADGERFPTRVMWSARGRPRSFLIADEAGAEDLMEMKGEGQAAVRFRDFLVLFTEAEIWRATPTLDAYAFRFDRVVDNVGCSLPKTIATTPDGLVFLGRDLDVYLTDGAGIASLGAIDGEGSSRIQALLESEMREKSRAFAVYNKTHLRYELYYSATDSTDGYPTRALFFDFGSRTWWPQRFPFEISSALDLADAADATTWDSLAGTWNETLINWDAFATAPDSRSLNVFSSDASTFRFSEDAVDDDGSTIDARWRSGGISPNGFRQAHLAEIWTDYEAASSSVASIFVGDARAPATPEAVKEITLSSPGGVVFTPTWKTARAPSFEVRIADGGRPRLISFQATLRDASKF